MPRAQLPIATPGTMVALARFELTSTDAIRHVADVAPGFFQFFLSARRGDGAGILQVADTQLRRFVSHGLSSDGIHRELHAFIRELLFFRAAGLEVFHSDLRPTERVYAVNAALHLHAFHFDGE